MRIVIITDILSFDISTASTNVALNKRTTSSVVRLAVVLYNNDRADTGDWDI